MSTMPALREITTYDLVELTEPVESIPAGACGGVLELRDGDSAMVEITSLPLDAVDRIVFVPLTKLRRTD
jgi:hypothetical protein